MGPLRKFLLLPPQYRGLLVRATLAVAVVRLALWLLPFRWLRSLALEEPAAERAQRMAGPTPAHIGWAVAVASRRIPRATCLTQALAAQVLLRRAGHVTHMRIGVGRGDHGEFTAHAWVESEGRVVIGGATDLERFARLPAFEGGAR